VPGSFIGAHLPTVTPLPDDFEPTLVPTWTPTPTKTPGPTPTPVSSFVAGWDHVRGVGPNPNTVTFGALTGVSNPGSYIISLGSSIHGWGVYTGGGSSTTSYVEMKWEFPLSYLTHVDLRGQRNTTGTSSHYMQLVMNGLTYNAPSGLTGAPGAWQRIDIPDGYYSALTVKAAAVQTFSMALINGIRLYADIPQAPPAPTWTPAPTQAPEIIESPTPSSTPRMPQPWQFNRTFTFSCADTSNAGISTTPIASFPDRLTASRYECNVVLPRIGPWGPWDLVFVEVPELHIEPIELCVTYVQIPQVTLFGIEFLNILIPLMGALAMYDLAMRSSG
jgi:hypothetical protein